LVYCTNCGIEIENSGFCSNCKASIRHANSSNGTAAEKILSETALQQHWVKRVIAIAIDSIIVGIATAILGLATDVSGVFNWMSLPFVMGLIYVLYFTAAEATYGYTIGKRLVSLKVTKSNGKKPSLGNAFVRNISKIHYLVLLFDSLAGFFISEDNHQRYADQIANTTVV
jgi:uncharacterized RDD family membrane protein YckC